MNAFEKRMAAESEKVYARIEAGDVVDVDAELLQARLDASSSEQPEGEQ